MCGRHSCALRLTDSAKSVQGRIAQKSRALGRKQQQKTSMRENLALRLLHLTGPGATASIKFLAHEHVSTTHNYNGRHVEQTVVTENRQTIVDAPLS